jgi:hypothetical protein
MFSIPQAQKQRVDRPSSMFPTMYLPGIVLTTYIVLHLLLRDMTHSLGIQRTMYLGDCIPFGDCAEGSLVLRCLGYNHQAPTYIAEQPSS